MFTDMCQYHNLNLYVATNSYPKLKLLLWLNHGRSLRFFKQNIFRIFID